MFPPAHKPPTPPTLRKRRTCAFADAPPCPPAPANRCARRRQISCPACVERAFPTDDACCDLPEEDWDEVYWGPYGGEREDWEDAFKIQVDVVFRRLRESEAQRKGAERAAQAPAAGAG